MREILRTDEFSEFLNDLDLKVIEKFDRTIEIVATVKIIPTKFVKKIIGTKFYEMRISVGNNQYRTVVFSINAENIIEATKIVLISSFLKKSKKQYKKEVQKAVKILEDYDFEEEETNECK
ncbi:MAG: type II toxin-antitoxin system RelE/ParE family toxin [Tenacibaculum sp.]|nr:type II toxin-antitoxin system RelE/ParE family toxin [Tenacibaculum sp.]